MSDTISRQAAIDALHMHLMYRMGTDSNKKRLDDWINSLPSAQSEIIRCRDCKYFAGEGMHCGQNICVQFDHFYCYYGERKE